LRECRQALEDVTEAPGREQRRLEPRTPPPGLGPPAGREPSGMGLPESKRALQLILEDAELIELARILMDDNGESALAFLKRHLKGKAQELLEGG